MNYLKNIKSRLGYGVVLASLLSGPQLLAKEFQQKKTSVLMPMIQVFQKEDHKKRKYYEHKSVLAKVLIDVRDGGDFRIKVEPSCPDWHTWDRMSKASEGALESAFGDMPNSRVGLKLNKPYSKQNGSSLSGPIAVALGVSLEGGTLKPGLTVAAELERGGNFTRPAAFWKQLKGLRKSSKPHRVLTPASCEKDFTQLIAMKELPFFILNEVVIVDDLKGAVKAASAGGDEELVKANKIFATVQKACAGGKINKLISHRQVRSRLAEVLRIYPNHLSAKILLLAGSKSDKKPAYLDDEYAKEELELYMAKLEKLTSKGDAYRANAGALSDFAEVLKDELTDMRGHLSPKYKDIVLVLKNDVSKHLASWARSIRQPKTDYHKNNAKAKRSEIRAILKKLRNEMKEPTAGGAKNDGGDDGGGGFDGGEEDN